MKRILNIRVDGTSTHMNTSYEICVHFSPSTVRAVPFPNGRRCDNGGRRQRQVAHGIGRYVWKHPYISKVIWDDGIRRNVDSVKAAI